MIKIQSYQSSCYSIHCGT